MNLNDAHFSFVATITSSILLNKTICLDRSNIEIPDAIGSVSENRIFVIFPPCRFHAIDNAAKSSGRKNQILSP